MDISQFEVGVNFNGPALMDYFANGVAARPTANGLPCCTTEWILMPSRTVDFVPRIE